jgi:TonB family protein
MDRKFALLVLVLMLIAGGIGRYLGTRPRSAGDSAFRDGWAPVPAARPAVEKKAAPKRTGLTAPRLANLDDLQANIRKYYPEAEHAAGQAGRVTMALIVGADGSVSGVRVQASGGANFDAAAKKVVAAMRFEPARDAGKPVPVEISEVIDFEYDGK